MVRTGSHSGSASRQWEPRSSEGGGPGLFLFWPLRVWRRRYTEGMASKEMKEVLERVLSWPEERQAEIVRAMELLEDQAASECELMGE